MSAAVPHTQLFLPETESEYTDEKRMLMDDLKISHGSVSRNSSRVRQCEIFTIGCSWLNYRFDPQEDHKANIFTGEEELFAFDRTVSRLAEMQTSQYWEQWEHHR